MPTAESLVNRRFGRLVVLYRDKNSSQGVVWVCRCDCGTVKSVCARSLKTNHTKSCGCLAKEHGVANPGSGPRTHGLSLTSEYLSYMAAKQRCKRLSHRQYIHYGGRGIEFKFHSFEEFFAEMGYRPEGKSIDRIDNNGHYEKGNLRWATPKEQMNNTRRSKKYKLAS